MHQNGRSNNLHFVKIYISLEVTLICIKNKLIKIKTSVLDNYSNVQNK
jgi:hypothetical protein